MSGSWESMIDSEASLSQLERRRALSNMRKADLIELVLLHERVNDEHPPTCVCVTCGLLHADPAEHRYHANDGAVVNAIANSDGLIVHSQRVGRPAPTPKHEIGRNDDA